MQLTLNSSAYTIETSGAGERQALLLHYFGGSGSTWSAVMRRVPELRCFAPSLAGFGETQLAVDALSIDQHAADMAALIEALGLSDFTLVGHSMGGKIALALAALQPRGLRNLLLVAPSPPSPEPMPDADRARLLAAYGDATALAAQIQRITGAGLAEELRAQALGEQLRASATAWRWWLEAGSREDISARLGAITVPVAILVGEHDPIISPTLITAQLMPYLSGTTATLAVLPAVGHLLPYEAPQAVADALAQA